MKKLFLISLLIAIGFTISAQGLSVNFGSALKATYPTYTVTADTSWTQSMTNQYYFDYEFTWAGLDQLDGSVKIQVKNKTDGGWVDYPGLDSLLLSTTAGTSHIRDTKYGTLNDSIRAVLDSGTCSAGTLKVYVNLGTKR